MAQTSRGAHRRRPTKSFVLELLSGQWFLVFASLLIMAVNGSGYMFGLYSNEIKSVFGYDQTTLNLLSFFKDLGGNVGVIAGLVYEVAPPWLVLSVGAAMNFFGYFMIWLSVSGRIAKPRLWQMCFYICVGANSLSFPNTAALVTCVKNFPHHRGCVLGLLKGYIGLSGAIMTQLYHAIYGDDPTSLILLLAWLPSAISMASLPIIRISTPSIPPPNQLKVLYRLLFISLAFAAALTAIIIAQTRRHFSKTQYIAASSVVILFLLLPLSIVIHEELKLFNGKQMNPDHPDVDSQPLEVQNQGAWFKDIFSPPRRGEDYTILQAVLNLDMAVLLIATTCGVGGALTVADNLGQIGTSLGYPTEKISVFVSLMSVWNFLGRVVAGYSSEFLLHRISRPLMLTLVILLSSLGHLLIATAVPNSLYLASMIVGFCLGAQLPLWATIISEIFGLKHYSTLYNVGSVSSPVGSYLFNVRVAGHFYDKAAGDSRYGTQTCRGAACYRVSFLIIAAASVFGSLVSVILVLRTRGFYRNDIYKRFRNEREENQRTSPVTCVETHVDLTRPSTIH